MANIIVIVIVALVLGSAIRYIVKEKKKGVQCIGCPSAGTCASRNAGVKCTCQPDAK